MKYKKVFDVLGTILLFLGFVLAFLPHAVHIAIGLKGDVSHTKHVVYGIVLVIVGLGILIWNNNALKTYKP